MQLVADLVDRVEQPFARRHVVRRRDRPCSAAPCAGPRRSADRTASATRSRRRTARRAAPRARTRPGRCRSRRRARDRCPACRSSSLRVYCMSVRRRSSSRWSMRSPRDRCSTMRQIRLRIAEAVDRRHRRDDDRVAALEQRLGRRQAHLLDVLVDRGVLLDVGVATTARRPRAGSSRSSETKYSTALCGKNSLNSP